MRYTEAFSQKAIERVCAEFVERGESVAAWARARGYEPPQVYALLAGRNKGRFGRGHDIAVALGLKPGKQDNVLLASADKSAYIELAPTSQPAYEEQGDGTVGGASSKGGEVVSG